MCGIAGYVGSRPASPLIIGCLERLQYRGYDSAGIAVLNGGHLSIARVAGPVEELRQRTSSYSDSAVGVGHTRWATNGLPTLENAHPLVSCDEAIAVVHNGIIENHAELRDALEKKGHRFRSQTDSEVIPHLIEERMKQGDSFQQAFLSLPAQLLGSFAIVAIHRDHPYLLVTRRGSPLVIGVGDGEYFPASDIPSFLPYTSRVMYLHEEDCLRVDLQGVHHLSAGQGEAGTLDPSFSVVDLNPGQLDKGGEDCFMIKEILEQAGVLDQILERGSSLIESLAESLQSCRRALFVGAGTSYHASLFAEYCAMSFGLENVRGVVPGEFGQFASHLTPNDLVVLVSQSGETADTITAGRLAKSRGSKLVTITNSPLSTLAHDADKVLPVNCGLEVAVAATKSYTAQLTLITLALSRAVGEPSKGISVVRDASNSLYNLTSDTQRKLVKQLAQDFGSSRDIFVLGRGFQNVTARESALKLKEVSGVRAEAFFLSEMKHGPLSLIDDDSRAIIFFGDAEYAAAKIAASELAVRGARIYTVGPQRVSESEFHIRTEDIGLGLPICQIAPIQLLSCELARLRGRDPDRPRNLAKSVTVA